MTRREALARLRQRGELRYVRGHWCIVVKRRPLECEEVLPAAAGAELVTAGLATVAAEGDDRILRPA